MRERGLRATSARAQYPRSPGRVQTGDVNWRRLLHPWWRPTVLALDIVGLFVIVGCWVFDFPIGWIFPFGVINIVGVALMWREAWIKSDPMVQRQNSPGRDSNDEQSDRPAC